MNSKQLISRDIELFYNKVSEETRLDKDYFANMLNIKKKRTLLELIEITENDGYLLPFSPHIMIAVKKQTNYGT